ncbi:hypothetical protein ACGFJC_39860 [Nonomuraea fuscirosea]
MGGQAQEVRLAAGGVTIWTPIGSAVEWAAMGTAIAGQPHMFQAPVAGA